LNIFPWKEKISGQLDALMFERSFLIQPDVYLRLRPGKDRQVKHKLIQAGIPFQEINQECLALENSTSIDKVITLDQEAVIQDLNSQQVIQPVDRVFEKQQSFSVWDCCAASGGKSILLADHFLAARLTVSDIRESILINLRSRFKRAGIHSYTFFQANVGDPAFQLKERYDLVIADVPCSGSGTWSRSPEQLLFFDPAKLEHYTTLQKKIALNVAKQVKEKGYFLYITCSIFKEENERIIAYLQQHTSLKLISSNYYIGYDKKADTLFAALFSN
jgi:16S rRNA (cytosine967-C5)-methyltransferase